MLKALTGGTALELHKQEVLLRCEQDRMQITADLTDLDSRTRWHQLAGQVLLVAAPKLRLFMPIIGFLISKKFSKGDRATHWMAGLSTMVSLLKSFQGALTSKRT
jgi:hypothetical protein